MTSPAQRVMAVEHQIVYHALPRRDIFMLAKCACAIQGTMTIAQQTQIAPVQIIL